MWRKPLTFALVFAFSAFTIASDLGDDQYKQAEIAFQKFLNGQQLTLDEKQLIEPEVELYQAQASRPIHTGYSARAALVEDFEGTFPPDGWTVVDNDADGTTFNQTFSYIPAHSGYYGAQAMGCADDYLITPKLTVSAGDDTLTFWYGQESTSYENSFEVMVSTATDAIADFVQVDDYPNIVPSASDEWNQGGIDLSSYVGQDIYVAFHVYYSESSWYDFGFDDIAGPEIYVAPTPPDVSSNPSPDSSATDVVLDIDMTWNAVFGATGYDISFGTDNPPTNIESGTDLGDVTSYTPTALEYSTTYYWSITPYNAYGGATGVPVWEYTTMADPTLIPPFTENFNDFLGSSPYTPPENWTKFTGMMADTVELTPTNYGWLGDDFGNNTDNTISARLNIYGTTRKHWLITPPIDLGDGTISYQAEFDLAYTTYSGTGSATLGVDDTFSVVISTDNGANWLEANTLQLWDSTTPISNTGERVIIDLSAYTGIVKIGFYGQTTVYNEDNNVYVDNFTVQEPPVEPILTTNTDDIDFAGVHIGRPSDYVLSISNTGGADLNITDIAVSEPVFTTDVTTGVVVPTGALEVTVTYDPTAEVADTAELVITSDAASSPDTVMLYGLGLPAIPADYVQFGFEPDGELPEGWTAENEYIATYRQHSGEWSLYFSAWGSPPQYLMSQRLDLSTGTHDVYFWWNETDLGNDDSCLVEMSSDGGATWTEVGVVGGGSDEAWVFESLSLGTPASDNVFIRWTYLQGTGDNDSFYLDDIYTPPVYVPPMSLFFSEFIEGGSYNKAFEIYNPTSASVDLSDYLVLGNYNGNPYSDTLRFPVGTMLGPEDVYVVAHDEADQPILDAADTLIQNPYAGGSSYSVSFNGDDVRGLFHMDGTDTVLIDLFGRYDLTDPGSGWDVAGVSAATKDHTLIRKSAVLIGNTDWDASAGTDADDSEWHVMPKDHLSLLGAHPHDDLYEPNDNLATAFPIADGDFLEVASIDPDGDLDFYTFDASIHELVTVAMFAEGLSDLDGEIAIFDADSVKLESADSGLSGDGEAIVGFEIPATGTYYILVGYWLDVRASTGSYAIGLEIEPAPPMGAVEGTVTDLATGNALADVAVASVTGDVDTTDAAGYYLLEYVPEGPQEIGFSAAGFHDVGFNVDVVADDTVEQNLVMVPDTMTQTLLYYTGFETTDDSGSVGIFAGGNTFTIADTFDTGVDTVTPAAGTQMLTFPEPDSLEYGNDNYAYWLAGGAISLANRDDGSLIFRVDANIETESGWDFFNLAVLLDDGYFYTFGAEYSGDSEGWITFEGDISWVFETGSAYFVPMIVFESDGSVVGGWGGAFDNVEIIYDDFYLAPVAGLEVTRYEADATLSWAVPATRGSVDYELQRVNMDDPLPVNENEGVAGLRKGPSTKEKITVTYEYNNNTSRSLIGYKVFRQDHPFPIDGTILLNETTDLTYTDATVVDGNYYDYAVTALYDEGESEVMVVSTKIGAVTQELPGLYDFESLTDLPAGWEAFTTNPDGITWVVGDSAAADSAFGVIGTCPAHTDFVFVEDGRGNDYTFETLLLSPFIDASDMYSAIGSFAGYEQGWGDSPGNTTIAELWVRVDMGKWIPLVDFAYDHNDGWVDYMGNLTDIVGGMEYVQFGVYYFHLGGYNSGGGNGIAIDDLDLFSLAGPTNLVAAAGQGQIELNWDEPAVRSNDLIYGNVVSREVTMNRTALGEVPGPVYDNRDVCYSNWLPSGWFTGFYGPDSGYTAPTIATLFEFPVGPMTLEKAVHHGIWYFSGTADPWPDTVRAFITVASTDLAGVTQTVIASDTVDYFLESDDYYAAELDLIGLDYEQTDSSYLKVAVELLDDSYYSTFDANIWMPPLRIDDPNDDINSGLSGYDSAGVFLQDDTYDWFLEICGTPTPPALRFNIWRDGVVLNDEPIEETTFIDDMVTAAETYEYFVTGFVPIVPASDEPGVLEFVNTDSSNHEMVTAVNTPPTLPSLASPPPGALVSLTDMGQASVRWST